MSVTEASASRPAHVPRGLGAAGRAFWREIMAVYELSPAEERILGEACRTLDLLARIHGQMADETLMLVGRRPR